MTKQVRALSVSWLSTRSGSVDEATMRKLTYQMLIMLDV